MADDLGTVKEAAARSFMHHRVMFMDEPSTKAAVAWTTADELFESHGVYWDTESRAGELDKYAFKTNTVRSRPYTLVAKDKDNKTPKSISHHVLLEDLKPATTYFLVIVSGKYQSREFHFVTAPDDDRPFQLLFGGPRWILVQYHVPSYGSVKEYAQGESQRRNWVPLFEEFGVDLVMEADHHSLKRTVPIYQDKENAEKGIVYIGDGALGVPQRKPDTSRWYLQSPGMASQGHHVHLLEFTTEKITGTAIGLEREIHDQFEIRRK